MPNEIELTIREGRPTVDPLAREWRVMVTQPGGGFDWESVSYGQALAYVRGDPDWRQAAPGLTVWHRIRRLLRR